jgi:hypothetical protein
MVELNMFKSNLKCIVIKEEEMSVGEIFAFVKEPFYKIGKTGDRIILHNKIGIKIRNDKIDVVSFFEDNAVVTKIDVWLKARRVEDLTNDTEYYSGPVMQFTGNGVWLKFKLDEDIFNKVVEKLLGGNNN